MADRLSYSVAETARLLGVSENTVRTYISQGRLEAIQPLGEGTRVLVPTASIYALLVPAGEE